MRTRTQWQGMLTRIGMLAVVALLGMAGCGGEEPKTVNLDASWAVNYHTMGELKAHSDLSVTGTFTKVLSQIRDKQGVPFTDFAFTVDRVLNNPNGRSVAPGTVLRIHQTGATEDNVVYQIADDPLFKVNEAAALFLTEYAPGLYRVVGGPNGRFEIHNGAVSPVNNEGISFSGGIDPFVTYVRNS